mmetsp:Transcript_20117/g.34635  ORF Transcript_20117/g.34635 Transcript_20117/m.34635 type:complete len:93 (-) Transcript_20117:352-630(-)
MDCIEKWIALNGTWVRTFEPDAHGTVQLMAGNPFCDPKDCEPGLTNPQFTCGPRRSDELMCTDMYDFNVRTTTLCQVRELCTEDAHHAQGSI